MQPSDLTDPQYTHDIKDDVITSSDPIASTREDCCELSIEDSLLDDEEELLDARALNKLYYTDEIDQGKELSTRSKKKNIRVDLTYARSTGPVVEMSVRKLNWKCYKAPLIPTNRLPCPIHWHGITHEEHIVPKGCYVSKFCGLGELCYKKNLAQTLSRMKELFPDEFSFHPNCWLLPEQYEQFYVHTQEHPKPNKFYIVKPHEGSQGLSYVLINICAKKSESNDRNTVKKLLKVIIKRISHSKHSESKIHTCSSAPLTPQHISSPSEFKHLIHWPYVPTVDVTVSSSTSSWL